MLFFRMISDPLNPVGWSLYHFLWQGMLIAALYSIASLMSGTNARRRYTMACFFLGAALVLPAWQVWMIFTCHHGLSLGIGPPEALLPWMTWAGLLWLCASGAASIRSVLQAKELTRPWVSSAFEDAQLSETAECIAKQLGLKKSPRVLRSRVVDLMAVIGGTSPIIVVPAVMPEGVTDAQFRALLAHEIAHVSRHDPLVNFALSILEPLVFFHPAAAWLAGEVRRVREYCCDDIAVQISGDSLVYSQGLAELARIPALKTRAALSANGGDLKSRVVRLLCKRSLINEILVDGKKFIFWLSCAATLVAAAKLLCRLM